ncbi:MAG TPA: SPOR domain-containing protein, partial [Bacteroidota bacterium]|nr:SPOR domain-containing protein [Bacteroidota bacterium]
GIAGCGSAAPQAVPEQKAKKDLKQPLFYYEATLDPSDYDEEVEVVQTKESEEKPHTELTIPRDSTTVEEVPQLGFRIQVFSTSSIDEAMKMKLDVLAKLPQDSVYVVYDPPVYKVRLGDFTSRYDASIRLSAVVDQGFPDAWIVPDNIVSRKLVRVPRAPGQ